MKGKILKALKGDTGRYVSGEALSEMFGVSRTAVWKHIKELKEEGYDIQSSSKKGYILTGKPDILNSVEIAENLGTSIIGKRIEHFKVIDSTNSYAKLIAADGCPDGTVVVADSQTAGRGRLGREWNSADKKGIWMSVVLRPAIAPEEVQVITLAASVAVASAIKKVTGIETGIKWPNDIILKDRKVCGILTEMSSETEQVNFLVIGMGINVNHDPEDFPEDLKNTAISLKSFSIRDEFCQENGNTGMEYNRSDLIKSILSQLERVYTKIIDGLTHEVVEEWKEFSVTLGKQVRVVGRNSEYIGTALDVTKDGRLVVARTDGSKEEVLSGEISVRGMLGYV